MKKIIIMLGVGIFVCVGVLSGCSVLVDGVDYEDICLVFNLECFFDGKVIVWGIV